MVTKPPPEGFAPFRGRSGRRKKSNLISFLTKHLGFADTGGLIQHYIDLFLHVERHQGTLTAVKKAKSWYEVSLRLASNLEFTPLSFVKSGKDGYPKLLSKFKTHLTGSSMNAKRAALTILQLYKLVDCKGEPSFEGIAAPYAGQTSPEWLPDYLKQLDLMFPPERLQERIRQLKPGFHVSGKNGPNGPALGCVSADRLAIRGTTIESACKELALLTGFETLHTVLTDDNATAQVSHKRGRSPAHSRIRIKYESGGKARPFAIVDFFSQSALKSIHNFFMDWLKTQPNDGTASHDSAAQAVKAWTAESNVQLFSYDLTEATNRWPLFLQELVVEKAFGRKIAQCWKSIIADRDFIISDGPNTVRYNCGQPLGALSSWAVFAVSHHAVARVSCYRAWKGKGPLRGPFRPLTMYDNYRLIGDDITLRDSSIAYRYRSCLADLAVEISTSKTVLPEHSKDKTPVGELAKRLFKGGKEITPIPPDAILVGLEPYGIKALFEQLQLRDYGSAESPYLVQSTLLSLGEFADLTFPFRNRLHLLRGLQEYYEVRRSLGLTSDFGSLNQNWFLWMNKPQEEIDDLVRTFLFSQFKSAEERSQEIITGLTYQTYGLEGDPYDDLPSAPQGGDWQPGPLTAEPELMREVLNQVQETLNNAMDELYNPGFTNLDIYKFIGRLQVFFDPDQLIFGRKARDEKERTRYYMSQIVKYCLKHID